MNDPCSAAIDQNNFDTPKLMRTISQLSSLDSHQIRDGDTSKMESQREGQFPVSHCAPEPPERERMRFIDFANLECERAGERCQSVLMFRKCAIIELSSSWHTFISQLLVGSDLLLH